MRLEHITKIYKKKEEELLVLNDISLEFEKGKFYAITGHSGSGKSTLMAILGLTLKHSSGKYSIDGKDVEALNDKELSLLRMQYFGFIFQNFYLDENLKAWENVVLPMLINKNIPKDKRFEHAKSLLQDMGLENRLYHYPKELSGGEQQRVAVARALANDPHTILADEPTGNLDDKNEVIIFDQLKKLAEAGKCVIVISHSPLIKKYADQIITLSNGKIGENI